MSARAIASSTTIFFSVSQRCWHMMLTKKIVSTHSIGKSVSQRFSHGVDLTLWLAIRPMLNSKIFELFIPIWRLTYGTEGQEEAFGRMLVLKAETSISTFLSSRRAYRF